jgi:hypothetical protein
MEERKAYGTALMSGLGALPSLSCSRIWSTEYGYVDIDYDPAQALWEDTIPINKKVNVEARRQNIGSED